MDSRFVRMLSWLLYAAILFPTIGPVVDHHFAERQSGHLHYGAVVIHIHNYGQAHNHTDQGSLDSKAVYSFESAQTTNLFHTGDELGLAAFLQFRPDSTFVLPTNPSAPILEPPPKSRARPPTIIA